MSWRTFVAVALMIVGVNTTAFAAEEETLPDIGSAEYLDAKNGFRDVTFGQAPTADMVRRSRSKVTVLALDMYARPHERLAIGRVKLDYILYGFYKERLIEVDLKVRPEDCQLLTRFLEAAYGGPSEKTNGSLVREWNGESVSLMWTDMSKSDLGGPCLVNIWNGELRKWVEVDRLNDFGVEVKKAIEEDL